MLKTKEMLEERNGHIFAEFILRKRLTVSSHPKKAVENMRDSGIDQGTVENVNEFTLSEQK